MRKHLVGLFLIFSCSLLQAQIVRDIAKPDWNTPDQMANSISEIVLDAGDLSQLHIEDSLAALSKDQGFRFGVALDTSINFPAQAVSSQLNDQLRFQLIIRSPGAYSINLNFDAFYLPEGSKFYISGIGSKDQLGALGSHNNKTNRQFSTRPISGEAILLELFLPSDKLDSLQMNISQVVHGYKDLFSKRAKTFNSSGSCNRNTNCPEAFLWQDIKRSVVLITAANNTRLCTGTLVNNVRRDSTPYLLTAFHCNLATTSVFIFGYENSSPNCLTNADGSLINSVSGAISRAEENYSDFKLFELTSTPPASYNPYYAGWDARGTAPYESTTIHHPSGDIKKISQDYDTATSSAYVNFRTNTHWQVGNWESGTTEPGSSGAPLFDQFKRVVGQLEGGSASCSNNAEDLFGKFSVSWNNFSAANRQLKRWLDPDTTNTLVLDGLDPIAKPNNRDVELTYVSGVSTLNCDSLISPVVHFMNVGNQALTSVNILYGTNFIYNNITTWTGTISSDQLVSQVINNFQLSSSDTVFNVKLQLSNVDQDSSDNFWQKEVVLNTNPQTVSFTINTDEYGTETSWDIKEVGKSTVLASGGPYPLAPDTAGLTFRDSLCLYQGCFVLTLYDSFGDGFNGAYGDGYVLIRNRLNDTLLREANFTGAQKSINFCVTNISTGVPEVEEPIATEFKIYPNPIKRGEWLQIQDQKMSSYHFMLHDLNGRLIKESFGNEYRIPERIERGIYLLQVKGANEEKYRRLKLMVD